MTTKKITKSDPYSVSQSDGRELNFDSYSTTLRWLVEDYERLDRREREMHIRCVTSGLESIIDFSLCVPIENIEDEKRDSLIVLCTEIELRKREHSSRTAATHCFFPDFGLFLLLLLLLLVLLPMMSIREGGRKEGARTRRESHAYSSGPPLRIQFRAVSISSAQ